MKSFIKRLFIHNDPLTDQQTNERIQKEAHGEYARVYFLFIALIIVATTAQLFVTRNIVAFLPAIIGGGGSLGYFVFMFRREGLFKSHVIDERVTDYKAKVKSHCFTFCLSVYIIGALPILFFDVPLAAMWAIIVSWLIPTCIAVVRIAKRGLYAPGSKKEWKDKKKSLVRGTVKSAVFFGVFMSLFTGLLQGLARDFNSVLDGVWFFARNAIIYAVFWGVLFYFGMLAIDKISERLGKKRLNESEEESDGDAE